MASALHAGDRGFNPHRRYRGSHLIFFTFAVILSDFFGPLRFSLADVQPPSRCTCCWDERVLAANPRADQCARKHAGPRRVTRDARMRSLLPLSQQNTAWERESATPSSARALS